MTVAYYNGVELHNVRTKAFRQENVYDESGTDLICHRFTINVEGHVHKIFNQVSDIGVYPTGVIQWLDAAFGEEVVRTRLMEPRQMFVMALGNDLADNVMLRVIPPLMPGRTQAIPPSRYATKEGVYLVDLENGPKPRSCNVTNIIGTQILRVEFELELHVLECQSYQNSPGVLSNRWTMDDVVDENWYTTRTVSGRLRVAQNAMNVNMYRGWVVPAVQPGFRRTSIKALASADGLTLAYSVVDKEQYACAPFPAVSWEATDSGVTDYGAKLNRNVQVRVTGHKKSDPEHLLAICASIIEQRVHLKGGGSVLTQASVTRHLHENVVEMTVSVLSTPRLTTVPENAGRAEWWKQFKWVAGVPWTDLVKPYEESFYNPEKSTLPPDNSVFGTATRFGLFLAYLQSPCDAAHYMPQEREQEPQEQQTQARETEIPPEISTGVSPGDLPPEPEETNPTDTDIDDGDGKDRYTYYEIGTSYARQQNMVTLPIAARSTSANSDTVAVIRMAPEVMRRAVVVTAQRYGSWPEVPKMKSTYIDGVQYTLSGDATVTAKQPELSADKKTRKYELEIEYKHVLSKPVASNKALAVGRTPWDLNQVAANSLPALVFNETDMLF